MKQKILSLIFALCALSFTYVHAQTSDMITCAEAVTIASALNDNATTSEEYTVCGYVTSIVQAYNAQYRNTSFYMADTQDGGNVFEAYRVSAEKDVTVGTKVAVTGVLKKYVTGATTIYETDRGTFVELLDTITIRFNPYSVDWAAAYLYVWTSRSYYSESYSIVDGQRMTITDDGWWTYSFVCNQGTAFYVGFDSDYSEYGPRSSYYYDSNNTYTSSTCFEYNENNRQIQTATYTHLVPDESNTFIVHVTTPGTFGLMMLQTLGELTWNDVQSLTVTGLLNETDLQYFVRMANMQYLDLSGTNITSIVGCSNLTKLSTVVLPNTCISINNNAFYGCKRLHSINLENIRSVGDYAFYQCQALTELNMPFVTTIGNNAFAAQSYSYDTSEQGGSIQTVSMPLVQTVGDYAFNGNTELTSVYMPLVKTIGKYAFANCLELTQVDIANAKELGEGTFYMYRYSYEDGGLIGGNLNSVILSDELERIPEKCFYGCRSLASITFPSALKSIGNEALPYLTDVQLPSGVTSVGNGNFTTATTVTISPAVTSWSSFSSNWTDVYCYVISPLTFSVFNQEAAANMTLHVPSISLAAYKLHDNWYKFGHIVSIDGVIDNLIINSDFMLLTTDGIANMPDLAINEGGALTMSAASSLAVGNYSQEISCLTRQYGYQNNSPQKYPETSIRKGEISRTYYSYLPYTGILLANSPISAENVGIRLLPNVNKWNFFSLPFDVNVADIVTNASQWVIREYSGANRASGSGATWINVPANGMLHAHKGYILFYITDDNELQYFHMPAVNNANKQNIFATNDVYVPLVSYDAEFPQNRSWNLVGNPYPCSFIIQEMDFDAPITTWNGQGYVAYTTEDDDYMLRPAEAFFVQAPQGTTQITFHKEGRSAANKVEISQEEYYQGDYYDYVPRRLAAHNSTRKVFNFTLSNAEYSDRARLVLNENASANYELTRDAVKMMSSDNMIPQLYVNDNGLRYAIDERPEQSNYILGAYFGVSGEYTMHVNVPQNEDRQIILLDTETQSVTNLASGDYIFSTDAGTFNSRFVVSFVRNSPTGMDEAQQLLTPTKNIINGQMVITTPQGKKYTVGGIEL